MEEKKLKILIGKSGSGSLNPRLPIPVDWFKKMGLSEECREIKAFFNEETKQIIIEKE